MKLDKKVPQEVLDALDIYFLNTREHLHISPETLEIIDNWKTGEWEEDFMCYYGNLWLKTFSIDFGAIKRIRDSLSPDICLALLRIKLSEMNGKNPPLQDTMKISTWRGLTQENESIFNELHLDKDFRDDIRDFDLLKSRIPQRWAALEKRLIDVNGSGTKKHKYWTKILRFSFFKENIFQVYPAIKWTLTILLFLTILIGEIKFSTHLRKNFKEIKYYLDNITIESNLHRTNVSH
jgi:hypothetical protein